MVESSPLEDRVRTALFDKYCLEIEQYVQEAYYPDALEKLLDFIRDHAPDYRNDGVNLYSRYNHWQRSQRNGEPTSDTIDRIRFLILEMKDDIRNSLITRDDRSSHSNAMVQSNNRTLDDIKSDFLGFSLHHRFDPDELIVARGTEVRRQLDGARFKFGPVDFEIRSGEITGIIGMNASGKTTMLKILLGDLAVSSGRLEFPLLSKVRADWRSVKNQIAYVQQLPDRWFGRMGYNLNHIAAAYGVTGDHNRDLVNYYMYRYGLQDYQDASWDGLSGGYKARYELVRALLSSPKLLLLDEPLANLDLVAQQVFLQDLRSLASSPTNPVPIVVTSQHLYEIESVADRIVVFDNGTCVYSGYLRNMPQSQEFLIFEIGIKAAKHDVQFKLIPLGLVDIDFTATGFLLVFKHQGNRGNLIKWALLNLEWVRRRAG